MRRGRGAAAHRRDERELVARRERVVGGGVLAVDGHDEREPAREVVDLGEGVGDARVVGQVELERVAAGALPENGEEADGDLHARWWATSYVHSSTTLPSGSVTYAARLSS